jgi:hypothetical protein
MTSNRINLVAAAVGLLALAAVHCTASEAKTAANIGLMIAADLCKEVPQDVQSDTVQLACTVNGIVQTVLMPRVQWEAMKAASVDAGKP